MRIAYAALIPGSDETGVLKKIVAQLRAWREAGHEVALFTLGHGREPWSGASDLAFKVYPVSNARSWLTQSARLVADVLSFDPDVVYHRFNLYLPALERLFAQRPVVVELNTLDLPEYRASMSRARFAYHRLTRDRILYGACAFVTNTSEVARSVMRYGRPALVLGNSIDLAAIERVPPTGAGRPTLILVASKPDEPWHGFDKLLWLAGALPEADFHVVGRLAGEPGALPANVTLHGFLAQAQYRALLARSDIGIGPLALHRKQQDENPPLKTREYLAHGLAVLTGHADPDFPNPGDFLLQLPNREDNVRSSLPEIRAFIARWQHRRVDAIHVAHVDTRVKERSRLELMAALARARR